MYMGAVTLTQESLSSGDPYTKGFRYFFRATNTTASSDLSTRRRVYTPLEAQNVAQSGWNYTDSNSYATLSFWLRSSVAGIHYFYLQTMDSTPNRHYVMSETLVANTWTKVVKTIPGNSSLQFDSDNGSGLRVTLMSHHATNYTGSISTESWIGFDNFQRSPDDATGWHTTTGATYDFTGVQLEVGSVATDFEHRSYGEELALCQRYFTIINNNSSYAGFANNANANFNVPLSVSLRSSPTASLSAGNKTVWRHNGSQDSTATAVTIAVFVTDANSIQLQVAGFSGNNDGYGLTFHTGQGFLSLDSEM
jgi:hypothetical protein